jgi:urea-proton symporter
MEQEGRRRLASLLQRRKLDFERIVKIGDPATKIAEIARKLEIDIIFVRIGLGNTTSDNGHVTKKEIGSSSRSVVLVN